MPKSASGKGSLKNGLQGTRRVRDGEGDTLYGTVSTGPDQRGPIGEKKGGLSEGRRPTAA